MKLMLWCVYLDGKIVGFFEDESDVFNFIDLVSGFEKTCLISRKEVLMLEE